jgi:hypothetical protein
MSSSDVREVVTAIAFLIEVAAGDMTRPPVSDTGRYIH